jgi:cytochrome b6-f complex iron-sulfur subunit
VSEKTEVQSRRTFFGTFSAAAASLAGVMMAWVGIGFLYPVPRRKPKPLFICLDSEISSGQVRELTDLKGRKVLLMRQPTGRLVAFGTICPHLGCSVYYRPDERRFECPCHQGLFDADGQPIAGPPQSPLARYATEVRDGKVFIQFG